MSESQKRALLPLPVEVQIWDAQDCADYLRASKIHFLNSLQFAIETGMRASEICGLTEINGSVARLEDTKNGTARDVPLSAKAIELFPTGGFGLTPAKLDVHFRGMRDDAKIRGLHFHDSRHTACTRLSGKLNMLQLQRMLGIKDPRILAVYFNESASDIAKLL